MGGIWGLSLSITLMLQDMSYFCKAFYSKALIKPLNMGCGRSGRDLNSGWNWLAIIKGWPITSMISTRRPSGDRPTPLAASVPNANPVIDEPSAFA